MAAASAAKTVDEVREKFPAALRFIEEVTTNCDEVQKKVLAEILSRNAETEYLKRHGLEGATDRETFRNKVPVVNYEDIQPDIQRIAHGDFSPILCSQPISEFLVSSGTSRGETKLIPTTDEEMDRRLKLSSLITPVMDQYRVGDVLRVTGFYNSTPQLKFVRRKNVLLSIDTDKTDESELQHAIKNASALLEPFNTSIVEYTSYADTKTIPGHYVIYCELLMKDSTKGPSPEVLDQCCLEMEEALNSIYRQCRVADRSVGPLEIRVVRSGTFEKLMDYAISRGASISQYKVPRCVSIMPMVELLDSRVVSTHFSPSMPHWSPERRI